MVRICIVFMFIFVKRYKSSSYFALVLVTCFTAVLHLLSVIKQRLLLLACLLFFWYGQILGVNVIFCPHGRTIASS